MKEFELIDSHCHLDFPDLIDRTDQILVSMEAAGVSTAVCISVSTEGFPQVLRLAESDPRLWATVGVHPDHESLIEPSVDWIVSAAQHPKVIAIGETGLDYFRQSGNLDWQRNRFRTHIQAAVECGKPLVVHTREAAQDTLDILRQEGASRVGGIMHCFTESFSVAEQALDMGFLISFSGILSFKSAADVRSVAKSLPLDSILVETDSPYLAPTPYRGKTNQPAYVREVAQALADARGESLEAIADGTTKNFRRLFPQT